MKINVMQLVTVASSVLDMLATEAGEESHGLNETKFIGAVRSYIGRNVDKETISTSAKESKTDGLTFTLRLSSVAKKCSGIDARAIHWLALVGESAYLGLGEIPLPNKEIREWLGKFVDVPVAADKA